LAARLYYKKLEGGEALDKLGERGKIGANRWGGHFAEEFLKELQGRKGISAYREMSENDDICGSILFAIELLIRQASWTVQPAGNTAKDQEAVDFIYSAMDDMQDTWTDTISEILSFLTFGWSAHELVYKRRIGKHRDPRLNSKYDDGLIGWMKLPIRSQETLWEWLYDDADNLIGMAQMPPPDYGIINIPIEKLLLFRTKSRKGNPEGRSILRNAYRSWYFKRRIQEVEGIGVERDLAGFPVLTAPDGTDIWDIDDEEMVAVHAAAENIVQRIRRDSLEGLCKPAGWTLELLSTGGRRQFDTNAIIERYDTRIAMTVLADFVLLGHQQVGSFALSSDKTHLFAMAVGTYLDIICEAFNNKAIPTLIDLNGEHFKGITAYPTLEHGDVEDVDIEKMGEYIKKLTGVGVLVPDDGIEDYVREIVGLPERLEDNHESSTSNAKKPKKQSGKVNPDKDDDEDPDAIEEAKKRLGMIK
jgi:hypothetical protein